MEKFEYENTMCKEILDHTQGKVDMILELFIGNMKTNFSDQVVIGERTENRPREIYSTESEAQSRQPKTGA